MTDIYYDISFYKDLTTVKSFEKSLNYSELVALLEKSIKIDNSSYMIAGRFLNNYREKKNLQYVSLLVYDIDVYNGTLEQLVDCVKKALTSYRYIYYTTKRSTFTEPRMRLIIFIDKVISCDLYSTVAENFVKYNFSSDFCKSIDKASYIGSQLMALPTRDCIFSSNYGNIIKIDNYSKVDDKVSSDVGFDKKENLLLQCRKINITDEEVIELLNNYNVETTNYDDWFKVCQALHHHYDGTDKGLELFTSWSLKDSREVNRDEVIKKAKLKYKSIKNSTSTPVTLASVIKIVKSIKLQNEAVDVDNGIDINNLIQIECEAFPDIKYNKKFEVQSIKSTYRNFEFMCQKYRIIFNYDIITKAVISNIKNTNFNDMVTAMKSLAVLNCLDKTCVQEYINKFANDNPINSFKRELEKSKWDGVDRLQEFLDTIVVEKEYETIKKIYLTRFFRQILYLSVHEDTHKKVARNILVLQSEQEVGKGTWIRHLMPTKLSHLVLDGVSIDTGDHMNILSCIKRVIVELAELEQSFKKTDVNAFKAFFGRTEDELNRKYLSENVTYKRSTSFIGTVNKVKFLKDSTGSTRFLVLPIIKADGYHNIDMLQLYSQILETQNIVDFELSQEEKELQKKFNDEFNQEILLEEQFLDTFNTINVDSGNLKYYNCREILLQMGFIDKEIRKNHRNDISNLMKKYDFKYSKNLKKWSLSLKNN